MSGLILGCLISALILVFSLAYLVNYLKISPSSLPIFLSASAYQHGTYDHMTMAHEQKELTAAISKEQISITAQEPISQPVVSWTSYLLSIILLIVIWFSGIFFTTFTRTLAEKFRDMTK